MNFGSGAGAGSLGRAAEGTGPGIAKSTLLAPSSETVVLTVDIASEPNKSPASRTAGAAGKRVSDIAETLLLAAGCSPVPAPATSCACITDTLPQIRIAPANSRFIIIPLSGLPPRQE